MADNTISRRQAMTGAVAVAAGAAGATLLTETADAASNMQVALMSLRQAREALEQATPNKGGHRRKALDLTNAAIHEVELGIKFAQS